MPRTPDREGGSIRGEHRLTREQRRFIDAAVPYEFQTGVFERVRDERLLGDLTPERAAVVLAELQNVGLAHVQSDPTTGYPVRFWFSSEARGYSRIEVRRRLSAVLSFLGNLAVGASGSTAVWALTRLFG